jgi:hypothetical protein
MSIQTLKNILAFLERVQMQGREAGAYLEACNLVASMIKAAETAPPAAHEPSIEG